MKSEISLGEVTKNIGTMFLDQLESHGEEFAFAQREHEKYCFYKRAELISNILSFSSFLFNQGLKKGDRVAFVTKNSYKRLVAEMAVMCSGLISVPIFAGYNRDLMSELLGFSDVKMAILDDDSKLELLPVKNNNIILLETSFNDIIQNNKLLPNKKKEIEQIFREVDPHDATLIMYTSGTTKFPKGVMLSHYNILSQQKALKILWKPEKNMRFLCYLPWHHSFGGLFERFFALSSAGCLAIDDSFGKDVNKLLKNFSEIKPNIYLSVPKGYQEIISKILASKEAEENFFHKDLKFVFTAAAPLPLCISDVFKKKGVFVVEGWGLTETSPCCTLTEFSLDRKPGVVGFPIPGVEIKLGEEDEILVRGPNVMHGYYKLPDETSKVIDKDKWFATGDLGEITDNGLKIGSRKDRVFKLSNGEKILPTKIEENVRTVCRFVKHAYLFGKGQRNIFLLIFPNYELLTSLKKSVLFDSSCKCPPSLKDFLSCFKECLAKINNNRTVKYELIKRAVIINQELTLLKNELTPSFKLIPRNIEKNYKEYMDCLISNRIDDMPKDAYVVSL